MKYSWMGHKNRNRHKNWVKRSGQAQLVYVIDINRNIPTTWRGAHIDHTIHYYILHCICTSHYFILHCICTSHYYNLHCICTSHYCILHCVCTRSHYYILPGVCTITVVASWCCLFDYTHYYIRLHGATKVITSYYFVQLQSLLNFVFVQLQSLLHFVFVQLQSLLRLTICATKVITSYYFVQLQSLLHFVFVQLQSLLQFLCCVRSYCHCSSLCCVHAQAAVIISTITVCVVYVTELQSLLLQLQSVLCVYKSCGHYYYNYSLGCVCTWAAVIITTITVCVASTATMMVISQVLCHLRSNCARHIPVPMVILIMQ